MIIILMLMLIIIFLTIFIYTIFSSDIYKDLYHPLLKNEKNENDKNKEFYDPSSFSRLKILKDNFDIIQKECINVYRELSITDEINRKQEEWNDNIDRINEFIEKNENKYWIPASTDKYKWSNYALMIKDKTCPGITKKICPNTTKILESIGGINIAGFSLAHKNCVLDPHKDAVGPSFGTLAYHLCLSGESTLIVNNKTVIQKPGKVIIFNSEFTHSLVNHTNEDRIILYIDFIADI